MQGFARLALSALLLISVLPARSGHAAPPASQQQNPPASRRPRKPQKNPATQANLPNAPSSIITGKPHGQGQIPLEDVPHPPVKLIHDAAQHRRRHLSHLHVTHLHPHGRPQVDASRRGRHRRRLVSGHSCRQGHRQSRSRLQQLGQHRLQRPPLQLRRRLSHHVRNRPLQPQRPPARNRPALRRGSDRRRDLRHRHQARLPSASAPRRPTTPASSTRPPQASIRPSSPATPCSPGPQPPSSPPSTPHRGSRPASTPAPAPPHSRASWPRSTSPPTSSSAPPQAG